MNVTSEKSSRTRILKLTQKFYDYFDVVDDNLKNKLDIAGDKKEFEKVIKDVTDHMIKEDSKTNEN